MKGGARLGAIETGETLGEIAFIDKGPRSATLVAGSDTTLIKFSSDKFEMLLAHDKELANKVYRSLVFILCSRIREATEALKIIPDYITYSYKNFDAI